MRELSSHYTLVAKYVGPAIWIFGVGLFVLNAFLQHPHVVNGITFGPPPSAKWFLLVGWLIGSVAVIREGKVYKRVRLDGDTLVISDYFTEHRIPLSAVIDVRQENALHRTITLELADPNPFGGIVRFHPQASSRLLVSKDDAALLELRQLAHLDPPTLPERAT